MSPCQYDDNTTETNRTYPSQNGHPEGFNNTWFSTQREGKIRKESHDNDSPRFQVVRINYNRGSTSTYRTHTYHKGYTYNHVLEPEKSRYRTVRSHYTTEVFFDCGLYTKVFHINRDMWFRFKDLLWKYLQSVTNIDLNVVEMSSWKE